MRFKYYILAGCLAVCLSVFFAVTSCGGKSSNNNPGSGDTGGKSTPPPKDSAKAECQPGGGSCAGDENCEEKCDNSSDLEGVFRTSSHKKACQELSKNEVDRMYEVFSEEDGILADSSPDLEDKGDDICVSAIENLLKIDDDGGVWREYIENYDSTSAGDVARWLAENKSVFDVIEKKMDDSDLENFIKDLFKRISTQITSALKTDISEDSDGEYFLGVAAGENDEAVTVVHNLGLSACLTENQSKTANYQAKAGTDYKNTACMMGEVYCTKAGDEYVFDDTFEEILDDAGGLRAYIRDQTNTAARKGLGVTSKIEDLEVVCPAFCTKIGGTGAARPSACPSS